MHGVRFGVFALACVLGAACVPACKGDVQVNFQGEAGSGEHGGEAGETTAPVATGGTNHAVGGGADEGGAPANAGDNAGGEASRPAQGGGGNTQRGGTGGGGEAGEGGEGAAAASGGTSHGGRGGAAGSTHAGTGGVSGVSGISGDGGTGGTSTPIPDQLDICVRLTGTTNLSYNIANAFERAMVADCNVNWVNNLYFDSAIGLNDRDKFLNALIKWNLKVWGCTATYPDGFALIYQPDGPERILSRGDAQALIDDYIWVAKTSLGLSTEETAEMRVLLSYLSEPALESQSDEFSNPRPNCAQGAGGAAGSAGTSGHAGTGGVAGAGAGGTGGAGGSTGGVASGGAGAGGAEEAGGAAGQAGMSGG